MYDTACHLRLLQEYGSALYQRMHVLFSKNKFQIACFGKNPKTLLVLGARCSTHDTPSLVTLMPKPSASKTLVKFEL